MQLYSFVSYNRAKRIFQYPRSDRRRCNPIWGLFCSPINLPFSILGRIGGDATLASLVEAVAPVVFQYPRSDRRRCNSPERQHRPLGHLLSVSSVGSEAMQRRSGIGLLPCPVPFSILGRIGGDATSSPTGWTERCWRFQYPRSDRRRCNSDQPGVQRLGCPPFSILGRIGGDATSRSVGRGLR